MMACAKHFSLPACIQMLLGPSYLYFLYIRTGLTRTVTDFGYGLFER